MSLSELKKFLNGKKVLITGHTGFVGSWLCVALGCLGADLIGFSWLEEKDSLYEKIKNDIKIINYYGDLRNPDEIERCLDEAKPDIIFHLAAYGFVHECEKDPYLAFSSNVMGTVHLMEAIKERKYIKSIVIASSDKVYRNNDSEHVLFSEEDSLGGIDPYSCSKTCEDMIVQSYYETYFKKQGKSVAILRPSNIIGGGDHNITRLIPSIIFNVKNSKAIEIRNPDSTRPWQYILDVIDAYIMVLVNGWNKTMLNVYNVGPTMDNIRSVGEIAKILIEPRCKNVIINETKHDFQPTIEKKYLGLSINKIKNEISWEPYKTLEEALNDTYEFYDKQDSVDVYELCKEYVEEYYEKR